MSHVRDEMILNYGSSADLAHYGVKGMKWGKRKASSGGSSRTTFADAPKRLTTEELTKRIGRMEAEKKYNSLNRPDLTEGRKAVNEVLLNSGKRVANTVVTGASLLAIKKAIEIKFGPEAASAVTRRLK